MPNIKTQRRAIYTIFAGIYLLCLAYGMSYFFNNSYLGDQYPRTRFDAMVDGYASKPFIYRQLVPIMIRSVDAVTPPALREGVNAWIDSVKYDAAYVPIRDYIPWFLETFPLKITHYKRLVGSVIILGFLVGYMAGIYCLGRAMFPDRPAVALFAPVFAVIAFSSFGYQWQYIYDIPCLCLSTACFYFMYKQRFRMYLLVFFLSVINKETAIFSLVFFTIWHWNRLGSRKFALLWALQCAIYISVKIVISMLYMNNPGFFLEQNMQLVLARDLLGESNINRIVIFAAMWFMLTHHWQDKPLFLKQALLVLPLLYVAYFFYGYPHEYRVFFDLHGPLILLLSHTLVVTTGIARAPVFEALNPKKEPPHAALP